MKAKLTETQQHEVRYWIGQGRTYHSVAAEYGVSESTIARIIGPRGKLGARAWVGPCVLCGRTQKETKVIRFSLSVHPPGTRSARGAGSIALCGRCWRRVAAPFQKALRARARRFEELDKLS